MAFAEYANKTAEQVFSGLETSFQGLSQKEASLRQKKWGLNETNLKGAGVFGILKKQAQSPFFYMLLAASVTALLIGEKIDSAVIFAVVAINVLIGFFQEYKAEKTIFLLKKFIPQNVKVLRSNKEQIIDKKELVPGDIVLVETGDRVPADLRIVKIHNFLADESTLTGESVPVAKTTRHLSLKAEEIFQAENMLFAGTTAVSGRAEGIVVNTGLKTAFSEIAGLAAKENYKASSYEKDIMYFSRLVLKIVVITIFLIFIAKFFIKGYAGIFDFLLFSVALAVSILPEGLPAVVSFALSSGSVKMAKKNVVVRRLSAIERLGNIDVLCTDKTGTLTKNKLSLEKIVSPDKRKCLLYGLLSSRLHQREEAILNPFDLALFDKSPGDSWREYKKYEITHESPFDSSKMRSSFVVKNKKGERYLVVKGAPEAVLDLCNKIGDGSSKKEIKEDTTKEGMAGKRVLALAYKKIAKDETAEEDEKGLLFLGYFVFEDPLKETSEEAIKLAKKLNVKIKIITGDSAEVAGYISKKIKLITDSKEVLSGADLERMPPEDFEDACVEKQVFARVSPEMKYKIVKCLQKRYDVGFLGDGVNDAPALRMANVGIAVEGSADISKEVSDIVLLKRDLRVVVEGIEMGRNIFANINKYIKCMLASNFGNFYSVAVISLFIDFLPMLPIQILLGNLLSDLPLISIVTDKVDRDELKKPKAYRLRSVLPLIINLAIIITLADFAFFSVFYRQPPSTIQTLWFIESVFCELLLVFIIRTKHLSWRAQRPSFLLAFSVISVFIVALALPFSKLGQKLFHFSSPGIGQLLLMSFILICFMAASELVKYLYFKYFRRKEERVVGQYAAQLKS